MLERSSLVAWPTFFLRHGDAAGLQVCRVFAAVRVIDLHRDDTEAAVQHWIADLTAIEREHQMDRATISQRRFARQTRDFARRCHLVAPRRMSANGLSRRAKVKPGQRVQKSFQV